MIWGTRYGDPPAHLKQTNILTFLQKIARNPKAKDLLPTYEYLCDIAHPSHIGNTRFWSHIEHVYPDGSERRIVSRYAKGSPTAEILSKILWSLGWSAAVLRNGYELTSLAVATLLQKLKYGEACTPPTDRPTDAVSQFGAADGPPSAN
jgi:hypothetical protein